MDIGKVTEIVNEPDILPWPFPMPDEQRIPWPFPLPAEQPAELPIEEEKR